MYEVNDKLWAIEYLRQNDEILNLNIIGAIENISPDQFNNPKAELKIYVDDLSHPSGMIVQEHEYWHYVYASNEAFVHKAKVDYFDALDSYGIDASSEMVYKILIEDREMEWEEHCILLYLDPNTFSNHKTTLDIRKGDTSYKDLVNDHYTYKDEESLYFIEESLRNRPSSFCFVDDEPVAWLLVHRDDSMGIMYTKEAHRKKGIAYDLSMNLLKQLIENNKIPFIHIGVENQASFKLAEKCGFKRYQSVFWFGIINRK